MSIKLLLVLAFLFSLNSFAANTLCEEKAIKLIKASESINFDEDNHITNLRVKRDGRNLTITAWVLVNNGDTKYTLKGIKRIYDHEGDCMITDLKLEVP